MTFFHGAPKKFALSETRDCSRLDDERSSKARLELQFSFAIFHLPFSICHFPFVIEKTRQISEQ
jgi:hypothetical protein